MAFEIPAVAFKRSSHHVDEALQQFIYSDIQRQEDVCHGSFGSTYKALYHNKTVAVKVLHNNLWDEMGKKFVKEAKFMQSLKHEHIAKFLGVSYDPLAIMLEYACFDFTPFGGDRKFSSLNLFLDFVSAFKMKTVESFSVEVCRNRVG